MVSFRLKKQTSKNVADTAFKAAKIKDQRKAFYWHIIPEPSCARKETVDIDILVTSRNGENHAVYQNNK